MTREDEMEIKKTLTILSGTSVKSSAHKYGAPRPHRFRSAALLMTFLAACFMVPVTAAAQRRGRNFGCLEINDPVVKIGLTGSTFKSSLSNDLQHGVIGGFSFLNGGSDLGGWQVEVLVHQKGSRGLLDRDDSLRITYLQGALLSHLDISQFGPGDTEAFYLIGGAGLSFKIRSSYSGPGELDGVGFMDFDLIAGAGFHVGRMVIEGRYDWGYISPVQLSGTDRSLKNRDFALMVGWKL